MSDLPAICAIEDDSFPSPYPRFLLQRLLQYYGDRFFVAVIENSELIGYCVCSTEGESAHLISIAVHRDFRRRGYGTALLQKVITNVAEDGVGELWLEVSVKNTEAISVYTKTGFERLQEIPNYYSDGSGAVRMRLKIRQGTGNLARANSGQRS
jgi:ribosomal-protein-alanine N-acetyltransferase